MLGSPAKFTGIVLNSVRYILSGSAVLSPTLNAVVGAVGLCPQTRSHEYAAWSGIVSIDPLTCIYCAITVQKLERC